MVKVKWNLFITMELIAVELAQQASSDDQTIVEQPILKEIIKIKKKIFEKIKIDFLFSEI